MEPSEDLQLGQLIVRQGLISSAQLTDLLSQQVKDPSKSLGALLVGRGLVSQEKVDEAVRRLAANLAKPSDYSAEPRRETRLGKEALRRGWITQEQLNEAMRVQGLAEADGEMKRLGEVLVEQKLLQPGQIAELLNRQGKTLLGCLRCGKRFNVANFDPARIPLCPKCKLPLKPVDPDGKVDAEGTLFPVNPAPVASVPPAHAPPPLPVDDAIAAERPKGAAAAAAPAKPAAPARPEVPFKPAAAVAPVKGANVLAGLARVKDAAPAPAAPARAAGPAPDAGRAPREPAAGEQRYVAYKDRRKAARPGPSRNAKIAIAGGIAVCFLGGLALVLTGSQPPAGGNMASIQIGPSSEEVLRADLATLERAMADPHGDPTALLEQAEAMAQRTQGSPYVARGRALAAHVRQAVAARRVRSLGEESTALMRDERFAEVRRRLAELAPDGGLDPEIADLRKRLGEELERRALRAFPGRIRKANQFAAERKFDEAVALVKPIRDWGVPDLEEGVTEALARFEALRNKPADAPDPFAVDEPSGGGEAVAGGDGKTEEPSGGGASERPGPDPTADARARAYESAVSEVDALERKGALRDAAGRCRKAAKELSGTDFAARLAERAEELDGRAIAAERQPAGADPVTPTSDCGLCSGSRTIRCGTCGGGRPSGGFPCPVCQSKGKRTCSACGGAGAFECMVCTAQKKEMRVPKSGSTATRPRRIEDPCRLCGDKRTLACAQCKGTGQETCGPCAGKGKARWTCPDCRGASALPCPVCVPVAGAVCPDCGAKGDRECGACAGKKVTSLACKKCQGTKLALCSSCQAGRTVCDKCDGLGDVHLEEYVPGGYDPISGGSTPGGVSHTKRRCKDCDRRGWRTCESCKGKGALACPDCASGVGESFCWWCEGKGRTPCGRCRGAKGLKGTSSDGRVEVIAAPISRAWPALPRARQWVFGASAPRGLCISLRLRGEPGLFFSKTHFNVQGDNDAMLGRMAEPSDIAPGGLATSLPVLLPYFAVSEDWFADSVSLNSGQHAVVIVLFGDVDEAVTLKRCTMLKIGPLEVPLELCELEPAELRQTQPAGAH